MAKKNQESNENVVHEGDETAHRKNARVFRPDTTQFTTLAIGEQVEGIFIGARSQTITDKRTRAEKELFIIRLRDPETDTVIKLPCASLMQQAWNDIVDEYGDGDEATTIQRLRGKTMQVTRGEDTATKGGNRMGTYEITIFE